MFDTHANAIARYAQLSPANLARVARFVLLTIQEPLNRAPEYMRRVDAGDDSPLWGFKREAANWWCDHAGECFEIARAFDAANDTVGLVAFFSQCPGLGVAKGGFLAQLAYGRSGCLDSHNLARFGIDPKIAAASKVKRWSTALTRAERYQSVCDQLGGTRSLWDSWCCYVAERGGYGNGETAEQVSALHALALGVLDE